MKKTPSRYPGVRPVVDRHGMRRFRFRRMKRGQTVVDTYLPGPWGGDAFVQAYEDAIAKSATGESATQPISAGRGTVGYVIEHYLASAKFSDLAHSTRKTKRGRLDRIRDNLGGQRLADIKTRHIEAIMGKFGGPHAANRFKKEMSELFNYAINKLEWDVSNPAAAADARGTNSRGHLTWTEKDIERFRSHYPTGTKPRLAFELLLNTGAARVDAVRLGPRNIENGTLKYNRAKTARRGGDAIDVPIPVLPALQAEIDAHPRSALTFLHHGDREQPYKPETFGNAFRDWCAAAGVPGRAHGIRKAGATRLAEAGATEWEIASFLGHASTKEAATYVRAASRFKMAAAGMAKLTRHEQNLSNQVEELDK